MNLAWGIRQRVGNGASFASCLFVALVLCLLHFSSVSAASGINQQINYQARLLDSTGAVVADGTYNMEFKIYQDGDGVLGGGDETLKWTETRTSGNKVTVKNGYFSVQLGSVDNTLGSSVDWNQDTLWLSTNIGGTGTPTWDGEMSPFRRVGAAAYALNSKQLGGLDWNKFVQIAPSAVQTDSSTLATLFLNKTGASGNILQLQKNGSDVLSVANDGIVTIGTSNTTGALLVLDTKTDTGDPTGINGGMYYNSNAGKFRCYQASAWTDCIGTGGGGGVSSVGTIDSQTKSANGAVINGSSLVMQTADGSSPGLVSTGTQTFAGAKTLTGAATFQNSADSTTAFRVLNASAVPLFVIDTANSYVYVGNPTADSTAALLILDSKNTTGDPTGTMGAMYYNSANNKFRCYENSVWWDCVGTAGDRSRRKPVYATDFLGPAGAATVESTSIWDVVLISSGTQAAIASEPSHPGILRLSSSTTANSGGRIMTDVLAYRLGGSETFECVFQPRVASNTNTTIRLGFLDATTVTDAVDGVYFELPASSLNIVGKTSNNSTRTTSSTIATLTVNTWYRAKIEVNSNATSVTFSIYDDSSTLLGSQTVSTNIPTASGRETGNGVIATNSGTTATLLAYFDYMATWQERVLTR